MSVKEASTEFGISVKAIYNWIGAKGRVEPGALEIGKLRRENECLKQIIGQLLLDSERGKKIAKIRRLTMTDKTNKPPSKSVLAKKLGIARSILYYKSKKKEADEIYKGKIEEVIESNPSYGHKRMAIALGVNHKKALRLMKKFDLKPKICRNRKFFKPGDIRLPEAIYRNEIADNEFSEPNVSWAGDFTYIKYKSSFIYLATIIDVCTREIIGSAISKWHSRHLVKSALLDAIKKKRPIASIFPFRSGIGISLRRAC